MTHIVRRTLRRGLVLVLTCAVAVVADLTLMTPVAPAAPAIGWNPGLIISDAVFYNSAAMSQSDVAAFLSVQGRSCQPGTAPCLKDYTATTSDRAADAYCSAYHGAANEPAAAIIWQVAQACGVNPEVLLVTLQKENTLITANKPSTGAYRTAMGYGCPDGAPCDAQYFGFFNQLYRAARQFKIYRARPNSFSFVAGRDNTVPYNPSPSCGSSIVHIQNQATAGLYNYTPYQPNSAALANITGSGDRCSAYGNRNFYVYFTQWFGDPVSGSLVVSSTTDGRWYLLADGQKHYIPSPAVLAAFGSSFAQVTPAAQSVLDAIPTGVNLSRYVRDPATGMIYYVDNGAKYWVPNPTVLGAIGGTGPVTDLPAYELALLNNGPALTRLIQIGSTLYWFDAGTRRPVIGGTAALQQAGVTLPAITFMSASAFIDVPIGPAYIVSGQLVADTSTGRVFLSDGTKLFYLTSWDIAAALGLPMPALQVSAANLAGHTIQDAPLSVAITCGKTTYVGDAGKIRAVDTTVTGPIPATPLSDATCATLTQGPALTGHLFIASTRTGMIYHVGNGTRTYMTSWSQIYALDPKPVILQWPEAAVQSIASMVQISSTNGAWYLIADGKKHYIPNPTVLAAFGPNYSYGQPVAASTLDAVPSGATLSRYVRNPATGTVYYVDGGKKHPIPDAKVLAALAGTSTIQDLPADQLNLLATGPGLTQFVQIGATLYWIDGATRHAVIGGDAALQQAGVTPAQVARLSASAFSDVPLGSALIASGLMVADTSNGRVYLSDGTKLYYLTSWSVAETLGLPTSALQLSHAALAGHAVQDAALAGAVTCGKTTYVGDAGTLRAVDTALTGPIPATPLSDATCATLTQGPALTGHLFIASLSTGMIYHVANGVRTYMTGWAQIYALDPKPVVIQWPESVVRTIPAS